MKIVKKFEDPIFFERMYGRPLNSEYDSWKWGLGENGDVYCQCSDFVDENEWYRLIDSGPTGAHLSITDMKRIVKEFGHLLAFL